MTIFTSIFLFTILIVIVFDVVSGGKPMDVHVTVRGKRYDIPNVSTVRELQDGVEEQSGLAPSKQGILFGGKKLRSSDILEDVGVEDGSVINVVPSAGKKKSSSSSSSSKKSGAGGAAASSDNKVSSMNDPASTTSTSTDGTGSSPMEEMLKQAGISTDQLDEMMKNVMPGGSGGGGGGGPDGGLPNIKESMDMMSQMMKSPIFQEYMNDPERLEQSRQMILQNPLMKSMMAGLPGFDEILNDPEKWRETMIAAANMYSQMGSGAGAADGGLFGSNSMIPPSFDGTNDFSGDGSGSAAALDELSEGED